MKHSQMHKLMDTILKNIVKIRDEGQKEYAHDENNVFANFERSSRLLDISRDKALMVFLLKHIDGIAAYVKGHKSQREDVRGRITDCIVYLMLLWGMIEEKDGIISKGEDNSSLHNVRESVSIQNKRIPLDRGRSSSNGVHTDDYMQKMRKTGNRIQESEEMGTT